MKIFSKKLTAAAFLMSFCTLSGSVVAAGNGKVDICHIPPGNPSNAHTITVSKSAVPAHLAHGDKLGDCLSVTTGLGNTFSVCDDRSGEIGRKVTLNMSGRVQTQRIECD
jgi:hypothetical protein